MLPRYEDDRGEAGGEDAGASEETVLLLDRGWLFGKVKAEASPGAAVLTLSSPSGEDGEGGSANEPGRVGVLIAAGLVSAVVGYFSVEIF